MSKVICQDCENIVKSYTAKSVIHVTNKQTCQKCENLLQYKFADNANDEYYLQCSSCQLNTEWYISIIPLKGKPNICPICENKLNIKWDSEREKWWHKQCSHCNRKTRSYKDRSTDMYY